KLNAGDELFLYTDGITEASNKEKELYGEERLLNILNKNKNIELEKIIPTIKNDISDFIQNEPQSDDTTSVLFKYNGKV
ncbi:MAG: serine/threonine-protein phosphatase, partial [bacterium]|nr:serine/threonine-protein phosphatase [bacterium]